MLRHWLVNKWSFLFCTLFFSNIVLLYKLCQLLRIVDNANSIHYNKLQGERYIAELPILYIITATYRRYEQRAELVRLCNTLIRVPNVHWIVVEDAEFASSSVKFTLEDCGITFTLLHAITPEQEKPRENEPFWYRPKGVHQRNEAFQWLRKHNKRGVMYIADDDNSYHIQVFTEMRWTKKVSVWPVALTGGLPYEGLICKDGKVKGFVVAFKPSRPFPFDMAGFAVNLDLLHSHPNAKLVYNTMRGFQESVLLTSLGVTVEDLEAKAQDCTKLYVWHTRTQKPLVNNLQALSEAGFTLPELRDPV